jgi:hypothetical protein
MEEGIAFLQGKNMKPQELRLAQRRHCIFAGQIPVSFNFRTWDDIAASITYLQRSILLLPTHVSKDHYTFHLKKRSLHIQTHGLVTVAKKNLR